MSDEDTSHAEAEQPPRPEDGTTQLLPGPGGQGSESARAGMPVPGQDHERDARGTTGVSSFAPFPAGPGSESAGTPTTLLGPRGGARPAARTPPPVIPGYEILEELGHGGMGVVYKARQISLNRIVALKMILRGPQADAEFITRFRVEAEAIARINHPNIVQIYEVGEYSGLPYFSLEFLEGGSLDERLDATPQPARWCAEICEKLAKGVHATHQHGIIHRDLKPANVLLVARSSGSRRDPEDRATEPKITDFGLARRIESSDGVTVTGQIMGTPSYMSPEQAEGNSQLIGPKSDVYSLGAMLYEMLTGRPPFKGATQFVTLDQVKHEQPLAPRRLQPGIPRDIETICLKCLQKEPQKRYASARELAADLRRFLDHEPIVARPAGPWERAARWAERRPAAAALIGVSALALVALAGGGLWYNAQLVAERDKARTAAANEKAEAERARAAEEKQRLEAERARLAEAEARRQQQEAEKQRKEATRRLADSLVSQADAFCLVGRQRESLDRYNEAGSVLTSLGEPTFAVETGIFELHRAYPTPLHSIRGHTDYVTSVAFSPDGKLALSGSEDKTVRLWDLATGRELRTFSGHTKEVGCVAFSPDGNQALSGSHDKTLKLWDVATGRELRAFSGHTGGVWSVAFSPDGKLALSGSRDRRLKLWDLSAGQAAVGTGRELRTFSGHNGEVTRVAFSPDGNLALSGSDDHTLKLWDMATGRELRTFSGHTEGVKSIAFSPDGKLALSGSWDKTLKVWDVATGHEVRTCRGHTESVRSIAFAPSGNLALSGSEDRTLKLWDVATGRELRTFSGHDGVVRSVALSPQGNLVLSGSEDRTLKLWDVGAGRELWTFSGHSGPVWRVAFSPDGNLALSGSQDNTLKLWDVATGCELRTFSGHTAPLNSIAFSPDGKLALSGSQDSTLKLWDVATGRELQKFSGHKSHVCSVAFSPDGNLALSGSYDATLRLWDVATGRELLKFSGQTCAVWCVAFSPDGKQALSGDEFTPLKLWDVATGRELRKLSGHTWAVNSVAFSPDGKQALSGSRDQTLKLWDVATGRELRTFSGHNGNIISVAFSPDAKLALSGSYDATVRLWDVATGRELRAFRGNAGHVCGVAFSPDGNLVLSGSEDKTLQLRDFSRPARYREFDTLLPNARRIIQKNENDAGALETFGEWYAFRGKNDWAVQMLENARKNGANVSPLTLARCYWLLAEEAIVGRFAESPGRVSNSPHYHAAAAAEFQKELDRVKGQPVPQEANAKLVREQEELYLKLCLTACEEVAARIAAIAAVEAESFKTLPAAKQVELLVAALKVKNPAYNGKMEHRLKNGEVTYLGIHEKTLEDVSPIRALIALEELDLNVSGVSELSPIRALKLKRLRIWSTQVVDLSPFKEMPLEVVQCGDFSGLTDLAPLRGAPLKEVYLNYSGISNLTPLAGKALTKVHISNTKVRDLAPLAGARLTEITLEGSPVTDLSPLKDMPLKEIKLDFQAARDTALLKAIPTLKTINGMPVGDFWKKQEDEEGKSKK